MQKLKMMGKRGHPCLIDRVISKLAFKTIYKELRLGGKS
jgi:hypothetical protein